ncbi:MAG: aldo/keto reductase [Acidobacteriota bacterium]
MRKARFKSFEISKLVLGTAQFGMAYGVSNRAGQPSYGVIREMLATAFEKGVNALDTATAYGYSEGILGRALQELGLTDRAFIITKVPTIPSGGSEARHFVADVVARSLENLRIECLPLCLLHHADDLPQLESLLALKEKGWLRHAGVSVYSPEEALQALSTPGVDAIQLPSSVLDQRFLRANVFARAQDQDVALFVRSVFLQGLLFLPEERVPAPLKTLLPARERLLNLAAGLKISLAELALRFASSLSGATAIVVGMETSRQLEANLRVFDRAELTQETLESIASIVPDLPATVLDPRLWPLSPTESH